MPDEFYNLTQKKWGIKLAPGWGIKLVLDNNLLRKNSNRGDRSPLDILKISGEEINPAVLTLPALDLDKLLTDKLKFTQGGHDVPGMSYLLSSLH